MSTLPDLCLRQIDILNKISGLKGMIRTDFLEEPINVRVAFESLRSLGEALKQHLAAEDRDVYPALLIHEDPKLKSLAWGFISGEKPIRKQLDNFYDKWLQQPELEPNEEFICEALDFCRTCEERINREQHILIPRLENGHIFGSTQAV